MATEGSSHLFQMCWVHAMLIILDVADLVNGELDGNGGQWDALKPQVWMNATMLSLSSTIGASLFCSAFAEN